MVKGVIVNIERMKAKILRNVRYMHECWEWTGRMDPKGYSKVNYWDDGKERTTSGHRLAYTLWNGDIPLGLEIDHLCRNRKCVNPDHLEAVTKAENNRRMKLANHKAIFNSLADRCINGHLYSPDNTGTRPDGFRICKTCKRRASAKYLKKISNLVK